MRPIVGGGSFWSTQFSINGTEVVTLTNNGYSWVILDAGTYEVSAQAGRSDPLRRRLVLRPGRTHYVEMRQGETAPMPGIPRTLGQAAAGNPVAAPTAGHREDEVHGASNAISRHWDLIRRSNDRGFRPHRPAIARRGELLDPLSWRACGGAASRRALDEDVPATASRASASLVRRQETRTPRWRLHLVRDAAGQARPPARSGIANCAGAD